MPIYLTADADIPLPVDPTDVERLQYRERAQAAVRVIQDMLAAGGEVQVTPEDRDKARAVALGEGATLKINESNAGALLHLEALLTTYDHELLDSVERLRRYVTNRLLEESNDPDPKIRLRALELLGKTSAVSLFSENVNVNVTHRTLDQVDAELAQLAEKFMGPAEVVTASADELDAMLASNGRSTD